MSLIDEKLKEIFKNNNIDNFIDAFSFLKMTGCYNDISVLANATHYFPENNINDYHHIEKHMVNGILIVKHFFVYNIRVIYSLIPPIFDHILTSLSFFLYTSFYFLNNVG